MLNNDYGYLYDYTDIKKHLIPQAVRLQQYGFLEKSVPCIKIPKLNMMVIFYVDLGNINGTNIRFLISNFHLRKWKVSRKRMIWTAFRNIDTE